MSDDKRRRALRCLLVDLLGPAAHEETIVRESDVRAALRSAGVPAKYSRAISQQSRELTKADDALEAADEWAEHIAAELDRQDAAVDDLSILNEIRRW